MILINDVARVLHDEVYRWGYGTSGQCNKNLGPAFLMVFRIGDMEVVKQNKKLASQVIFNQTDNTKITKHRKPVKSMGRVTSRAKKNEKWNDTVHLASLPGIQGFSDRALLGMLKAFAGINRNQKLLAWKDDFRLGAGVGAVSLGMIFGMDAGWAVEGAVGSEYKVDATYLSPHVNMTSRMMGASKQFGVTILLSQAVEKLLSDQCRAKLRHLDTVTVKGSSVQQRIYTYDARSMGVNFFMYDKLDDEADFDSQRYTSNIWNTDQDLCAMRQHVTEEFHNIFNLGRGKYLKGEWKEAVKYLKRADDILIETMLESGYLAYDAEELKSMRTDEEIRRLKDEIGDGPSRCLISYMERRGCIAPQSWQGYRPLTSK